MGKIKKIFISLPMKGLTKAEIERTVKEETEKILDLFPDVEIVKGWDTLTEDPNNKKTSVEYFADGIPRLAKADAIWLVGDWHKARGCILECLIAKSYGIIQLNGYGSEMEGTSIEKIQEMASVIREGLK